MPGLVKMNWKGELSMDREELKEKCKKIWGRHAGGHSRNLQGRVRDDAQKLFPDLKGKDLKNSVWNAAFWS